MSGKAEADGVRGNQAEVADSLEGIESGVSDLGDTLRADGGGSAAAAAVAEQADRVEGVVGLSASLSDYISNATDAEHNEHAERLLDVASDARRRVGRSLAAIRRDHAIELREGAVFGAAGVMSSLATAADQYATTEADVVRLTNAMMNGIGARAEAMSIPYYQVSPGDAMSGVASLFSGRDTARLTATVTIQHLAAILGINLETPEGIAAFEALAGRLGGSFLAFSGLNQLNLTNLAMKDVIAGIDQANQISLEDFRARYQGVQGWFRHAGEEWAEVDVPVVSHAFVALEGFMVGLTEFGYQTLNGLKTLVIDPTDVVNGDFLKNTWNGIWTSFTDLNPANLVNGKHGKGEYDGLLGYSSSVGNVTGAIALSMVSGGAVAKATNVAKGVAGGATLSAAVATEARAFFGALAGSTAGKLDFAARAATHLPGLGESALRISARADDIASWGKNVTSSASLIDHAAAAALVDGRRGNIAELGIRGATAQSLSNLVTGIRAMPGALTDLTHRAGDTVRAGGDLLNGATREAGATASGLLSHKLDTVAAHLPEGSTARNFVNGVSDRTHDFGTKLEGSGLADQARWDPNGSVRDMATGIPRRFETVVDANGSMIGMVDTTPETLVRTPDGQWVSPNGDPDYAYKQPIGDVPDAASTRIIDAEVVAEHSNDPVATSSRVWVTEEERISAGSALDDALLRTDYYGNPNPSIRFADGTSLTTVVDVVEQAHARIPEFKVVAETPGPIGQKILDLAENPTGRGFIYLDEVTDNLSPTAGFDKVGYKVHIYAESMSDVAEIADRVVPGLVDINANAKFHDGTQPFSEQPKGVTVYFDPDRPLAESVSRVLEDLGEWKSGALTGDIDLSGGVGLRYDGAIEPGAYGDLIPKRYVPESGLTQGSMLELHDALIRGAYGPPAPVRAGWAELMDDWATTRDLSIHSPDAYAVGDLYRAGLDADVARQQLGLSQWPGEGAAAGSQWELPTDDSLAARTFTTPNQHVVDRVPNGGVVHLSTPERYFVSLMPENDGAFLDLMRQPEARLGQLSVNEAGSHLVGNIVSVHGTPHAFAIPGTDGQATLFLGARDLADHLRSQPGFLEGQPVHLVSCEAGSAYLAQQLANELGVTVYAPEFPVGIAPNLVTPGSHILDILNVTDADLVRSISQDPSLIMHHGALPGVTGAVEDMVSLMDPVNNRPRAFTLNGEWKIVPVDDAGNHVATFNTFEPHRGPVAIFDEVKATGRQLSDLANDYLRPQRPLTLDDFDPRSPSSTGPSAERIWHQMHAELTADDVAAIKRNVGAPDPTPDPPIKGNLPIEDDLLIKGDRPTVDDPVANPVPFGHQAAHAPAPDLKRPYEGRWPETRPASEIHDLISERNAWARAESTSTYEFAQVAPRAETTFVVDAARTDALVTRIAETNPLVLDRASQGVRLVVMKGDEFIGQGGVTLGNGSTFARDLSVYSDAGGVISWADGTPAEGLVVHVHASPDGFAIAADGDRLAFGPHEMASYLDRSGALDGLTDGAPVTIAGCELAGPVAQELANILDRPVIAATDLVVVADGRIGGSVDGHGFVASESMIERWGHNPAPNPWVRFDPSSADVAPTLQQLGSGPIDDPWSMPHYSGHDPIGSDLGVIESVPAPSGRVGDAVGRLFRIEGNQLPDGTSTPMPAFSGPEANRIVDGTLTGDALRVTDSGTRVSIGGNDGLLDVNRSVVLGENTPVDGDLLSLGGDPDQVTVHGVDGARAVLNATETARQLERTGAISAHRPIVLAEQHSITFGRELSLEHAGIVVQPNTATTTVIRGETIHLVGHEPVNDIRSLYEESQSLSRVDDPVALADSGRQLELRDEAGRLRYFVDDNEHWRRVVVNRDGNYTDVFSTVELPETRAGVVVHNAAVVAADFTSAARGAINGLPEDHLLSRAAGRGAPTGISYGDFDPARVFHDPTIEVPRQRNPLAALFEISSEREFHAQLVEVTPESSRVGSAGPIAGDLINADGIDAPPVEAIGHPFGREVTEDLFNGSVADAVAQDRLSRAVQAELDVQRLLDRGEPIPVYRIEPGSLTLADVMDVDPSAWVGPDPYGYEHLDGDPGPWAVPDREPDFLVEPKEHELASVATDWHEGRFDDTKPTPEQIEDWNVRAQSAVLDAVLAEPTITPVIQEVAQRAGVELKGLDHLLKQLEAAQEKTQSRRGTVPNDLLRYTMIHRVEGFGDAIDDVAASLQAHGFEPFKWKDSFGGERYQGLNTGWRSPSGQIFELQFHTPTSFALKDEVTHVVYEAARDHVLGQQTMYVDEFGAPVTYEQYNDLMNDRLGAQLRQIDRHPLDPTIAQPEAGAGS